LSVIFSVLAKITTVNKAIIKSVPILLYLFNTSKSKIAITRKLKHPNIYVATSSLISLRLILIINVVWNYVKRSFDFKVFWNAPMMNENNIANATLVGKII
jgi:hypothetical protein